MTAPTGRESEPLLVRNTSVNSDKRDRQQIVDGLPFHKSLRVKSLYLLGSLGTSSWGRFSAIYYNLHGLTSQQVGIIEGLNSAIPTVSMILWGYLSDRFRSRKAVWLTTKTVSTAVLLTLAVPYIYSPFVHILSVSVLAQLFVSDAILDAYTLDELGTENKMFYGRYRLYASLGWGIGSIIMGWITDNFGFEPNFILFGTLSSVMIFLVATRIPNTQGQDQTNNPNESESRNVMELVHLALRPRVFVFLVEVMMMGAAMATVERLLFLYMVNDLEASTLLCGLSVGVNVLFEVPIFWYAGSFMKLFGHDGLFILSMVCFVVRVFGYTLLTPATKWWILLLEMMHGITFACFLTVTTDISKVLIHQTEGAHWRTAIPSFVQMLYTAVGASLGSVLGGWAMHRFGSREMYQFTAGIIFCTLAVQTSGTILSRVCCNGKSFLPDYQHELKEDCAHGDDTEQDRDEEENEERNVDKDTHQSRRQNRASHDGECRTVIQLTESHSKSDCSGVSSGSDNT